MYVEGTNRATCHVSKRILNYGGRLTMFERICDQDLIHIYIKAMTLILDSHFVYLLGEEINKRNLSLMDYEIDK